MEIRRSVPTWGMIIVRLDLNSTEGGSYFLVGVVTDPLQTTTTTTTKTTTTTTTTTTPRNNECI